MESLQIDADMAIEGIGRYLADLVKEQQSQGVLVGLSGGLDSSVLVALAVRALGPGAVKVAYLHDRDSDHGIAANARLMARHLGLTLEVQDISGEMAARGIYRPLFIKALRLTPVVARISAGLYRRVCGETPFKSTLRIGAGEALTPWYKRAMFDMTMRHVDAGFSCRHIFRRARLEKLAKTRNLSLIGAANLSEARVGWFVKDGIDDLPVQPMTGLYKTQVRQLARALGLPAPVREQLPSPDMARGVSDEFGIGHDYSDVDIVLDGIDRGLDHAAIAALGVSRDEVEDIADLMRLSAWKRLSPHVAPPVSGRFGEGLRAVAGDQPSARASSRS